jgi:hypothetical protein
MQTRGESIRRRKQILLAVRSLFPIDQFSWIHHPSNMYWLFCLKTSSVLIILLIKEKENVELTQLAFYYYRGEDGPANRVTRAWRDLQVRFMDRSS